MAAPETQSVKTKKMLPWLKRLKGALDDDDSSDSTSQPLKATPQKATKDKKPQHGKKRRHSDESVKRQGKSRIVRQRSKSPKSAGKNRQSSSESSTSGVEGETRRRRVEKTVARRKRLKLEPTDDSNATKTASKDAKTAVDATPANATASREQRIQKLRVLRHDNGEGAKLMAFKLKRQQSTEAFKERERSRMRAIRATRRVSEGADADVEDEGDRRPSSLGKKRPVSKSGNLKRVVLKNRGKKKSRVVSSEPAGCEEEAVAGTQDVHIGEAKQKTNDDEDTTIKNELLNPETKKEESVETSVDENVTSADAFIKEETDENNKVENATCNVTSSSNLEGVCVDQKPNEKHQATPLTTVETTVVLVKQEDMTVSSGTDTNDSAVVLVKEEKVIVTSCVVANDASSVSEKLEEGELTATVKSTPDSSKPQLDDGEKNVPVKNEQVLFDEMPIPRKTSTSRSDPNTNASSFVIPKRSFSKPVGQMEPLSVQADADGNKRSLESRIPVVMKPLPSPELGPQMSKPDQIRPQRKRTKNPVPVKHVAITKQDRDMLRLARRRNSIFLATAEIRVQLPDVKDATKTLTSRMIGYEILDVHGNAVPDLIPRLSCATKREMASNRESYAASFFGVSLDAPTTNENSSVQPDSVADEAKTREINCYEKLRFERPNHREFYQQRMYGTTFVPQSLRGWITVIIRNARFERKSTGIRFNQDRDRDEFAASLVKRYTINSSVPRCDIPRETWQKKLLRNQPGTVYLHYYNREDAKLAPQIFRDDFGNPLQLKTDYKAGVVINPSCSPAVDLRLQGAPRRSSSSERNAPRPSPLSSQNGSARGTPMRQRDRLQALKGGNQFSRYDHGPPPGTAPWPRDEARSGPSFSGNKRPRRSRSRSHQRLQPLSSDHDDTAARSLEPSLAELSTHVHKARDEMASDHDDETGVYRKNSDGSFPQKRARSRSPPWPQSRSYTKTMSERRRHNDGVNGERDNRAIRAQPGGNEWGHHTMSPGRWSQPPIRSERHEQRGRSREKVVRYRQSQERVSNPQDNKTRPRSPRRQASPSFTGHGGHQEAPYRNDRRQGHQDFAPRGSNSHGGRHTSRYDGQDYGNRGRNDRRGDMQSHP